MKKEQLLKVIKNNEIAVAALTLYLVKEGKEHSANEVRQLLDDTQNQLSRFKTMLEHGLYEKGGE